MGTQVMPQPITHTSNQGGDHIILGLRNWQNFIYQVSQSFIMKLDSLTTKGPNPSMILTSYTKVIQYQKGRDEFKVFDC